MTNNDWKEVLEHTRKRVREAGLIDIDHLVMIDFVSSTNCKSDLLSYLSQLIIFLKIQSDVISARVLNKIQKYVETENGEKVTAIEILFTESEAQIYETNSIHLSELSDLTPLVLELKRLKCEIENIKEHSE